MKEIFGQIIDKHRKWYPLMEPQDFGKLAFQCEFGAEHMVCDGKQAESFLMEEWNALAGGRAADGREPVLPVSGSLCRFPLSACRTVDDAKLLARLFAVTAGEHRGTVGGLEEKLEQLKALHIPGMEEWAAQWKQEGYAPVHHSHTYRENYQPHYRLIQKEFCDYFPVLSRVYGLAQRKDAAVVAIDGRCGSGKTYLAGMIRKLFSCNICHMDDFYLPLEQRRENWTEIPGGNMDFRRFLTEVLHPAGTGKTILYRPYDCKRNRMGETVRMAFCGLTVVEGSYSRHPVLAGEYDLAIFLTCSREEQRRRLQVREGSRFSAFEKMWIPMEENYLEHFSIETGSHLVIDTTDFWTG